MFKEKTKQSSPMCRFNNMKKGSIRGALLPVLGAVAAARGRCLHYLLVASQAAWRGTRLSPFFPFEFEAFYL